MIRSTQAQKAERLNAAHALLRRGVRPPKAAEILSRDFDLSLRQAYRYLEEAETIGRPAPIPAPSIAITMKLPENIVRDLRAYSRESGMTIGEIVSRALATFLATIRRHG